MGSKPTSPKKGTSPAKATKERRGVKQVPLQILVSEATREALRQRSEATGTTIRYIVLHALAEADIAVPDYQLAQRFDRESEEISSY
jgi:NaMN:DMB phosphoribosyltransferase